MEHLPITLPDECVAMYIYMKRRRRKKESLKRNAPKLTHHKTWNMNAVGNSVIILNIAVTSVLHGFCVQTDHFHPARAHIATFDGVFGVEFYICTNSIRISHVKSIDGCKWGESISKHEEENQTCCTFDICKTRSRCSMCRCSRKDPKTTISRFESCKVRVIRWVREF